MGVGFTGSGNIQSKMPEAKLNVPVKANNVPKKQRKKKSPAKGSWDPETKGLMRPGGSWP